MSEAGCQKGGVEMTGFDCCSELLMLARRRALTRTEMLALRTHLADCPSCRLAQQVAEDFNQEPVTAGDDNATVLGISELARRWAHQHDRRRVASAAGVWRPVRIAVMTAACLVSIIGTVSAVRLWRRSHAPEAPPQSWTAASVPRAPLFPRAVPVGVTPASPPAAPKPPAPSQAAGVQHASGPMSAALLLQHATQARRRGDITLAITLYRRLQRVFPASPEATLSAAPLGGLLLERGGTLPALAEFDRYLQGPSNGVLVPEALYGRGRALRALGDATEERRTWRRLVDAFPDSPYTPLARRRLADLQ